MISKLEKEDIIIDTVAAEGFSAVSADGITVGLKLELNEELIQEGIVRDLVRQVQNIRKDAGFSVEDRINIHWELNGEFQEAVSKMLPKSKNSLNVELKWMQYKDAMKNTLTELPDRVHYDHLPIECST